MSEDLRVAFFPDSYLEVNGAAMTCRRLTDFAAKNERPFLVVHAGPKTELTTNGSVTHLSLKRSPLKIALDEELAYDTVFHRHYNKVRKQILEFKPDVLHITGLNDVSIIGVILGWRLNIPVLGSWHTNIHEFAARRIERMFRFLPNGLLSKLSKSAEHRIMQGCVLWYKIPQIILSPNQELVDDLGRRTGRDSRLMGRGVDPEFFGPHKRTINDKIFRLGSVGRLRAEKNVRVLVDVEKAFIEAGIKDYEFLVVGEGTEREYLEENLRQVSFTGFLEGEPLAEAYANMDVFLFPSETDAFGNVAQEANASGMPAIVSDKGGPKFIIREGVTGFVAHETSDYAKYAVALYNDREKLDKMKLDSRENALTSSWDSIFEGVYTGYRDCVKILKERKALLKK